MSPTRRESLHARETLSRRLGQMIRLDHNSVGYLHRSAEVTKPGLWVRLKYAGDPDVAPPPLARL